MTPARLMTAALWLVAGGAALALGDLASAHFSGRWDRAMDAELEQLEGRERANPSPRGDPVQNAAVGAAGVTGACCLGSFVFYPFAAVAVIRGRWRLVRRPPGQRVWSDGNPDWFVELLWVSYGLLFAILDLVVSLPLKAAADLAVVAGWLVGAAAVRWHRRVKLAAAV